MNTTEFPSPVYHCRKSRNLRAFTLVELLTIVAIIGVLSLIALSTYGSYVDKARRSVAVSTLDTLRKSIELYHVERQAYPQTVNFSTGDDQNGNNVIEPLLLSQISEDLTQVQYNSVVDSYFVKARAKDKAQTLYTLTPNSLTN